MNTILINGYTGKLGQAIYQHLKKDYTLIGCNRSNPIHPSYKPDIIIDVTNAKAIHHLIPLYQEMKIPTIIGTSGISPQEAYSWTQKAKYPLLIVPNFSLSFQKMAKHCLSYVENAESIHIIETHHKTKVDSPSGTSLFLAHALGAENITSLRVNEYIAKHEVIFQHPDHEIRLSHQINHRSEFLPGVIFAIKKLSSIKTGQVLFSE